MSVTISKPLKNAETGKWEVEVDGEVFEFDSRKEAKEFSEQDATKQAPTPAPVVEPVNEESEAEEDEEDEEVEEETTSPLVGIETSSPAAQALALVVAAGRMISSKIKNLDNGLSKLEIEILNILPENGSLTQREIASKLGLATSNVGQAIIRLEDADLVFCKRNKPDRRTNCVVLTNEGKEAKKNVVSKREETVNSCFGNFNQLDVSNLIGLLNKFF